MSKLEKKMRSAKAAGKTYEEVAETCGVLIQKVHAMLRIKRIPKSDDLCSSCGAPATKASLHAHHVNYITDEYRLLCPPCHGEAHYGISGDGSSRKDMLDGKSLSKREVEVRDFILDGLKNWQIAEKLGLSRKTVEKHRANVYAKLGINSMVQLFNIQQREH